MWSEIYRGRKVLITGHTGFKGSWLAQWLLDLGAEVCGFSIDIPSQPSLFEVLALERKLHHHFGDIRNLPALKRVFDEFQPEMVFHLAAQPIVRASYDDPKATFDTNVGGTVNVLECLRRCRSVKAAVLVATDKCYENPETEHPFRESDPLGGKDPYSASKACAEIVFGAYQRSFFESVSAPSLASARAGNVIGGGDWAADRIVPDCIRSWSQGKPVTIRNPGSTRPWQHVLEPLSGYLVLGSSLWQSKSQVVGESFNFGPLEGSARTVADLLVEAQKSWSHVCFEIDPAGSGTKKEARFLRLDCAKASDQLGWKACLSFEESVRMTLAWYRANLIGREDMSAFTLRQIRDYQLRMR